MGDEADQVKAVEQKNVVFFIRRCFRQQLQAQHRWKNHLI